MPVQMVSPPLSGVTMFGLSLPYKNIEMHGKGAQKVETKAWPITYTLIILIHPRIPSLGALRKMAFCSGTGHTYQN